MSGLTAHGSRAGTKTTRVTKTTNNYPVSVIVVVFVIFVPERCPSAVAATQRPSPPTQAQQRPVLRAGAHYVRVDAYPTGKDGRILEGLTKDDFEILEDGRPQAIERAEYITFDTWTPEGERKDPRTQQDAYDLAGDPTWRAFAIVIDPAAYGLRGQYYLRRPLHDFLERNLGPRDLFGLLTTANQWTDLELGQKTNVAGAVLDSRAWLEWGDNIEQRPALNVLYDADECGESVKVGRKALDNTYSLLEGLVKLLGLIREEKKSVVFVSNGLATPGPEKMSQSAGLPSGIPGLPRGPVARVPRGRPPTGGTSSPVGPGGHGDRIVTPSVEANCDAERRRLANIDFMNRFRELLRDARRANVAFYPISPLGLETIPTRTVPHPTEGALNMTAYRAMQARNDTLLSLASETDGIAVVGTNDFAGGMRRIANDVQSYYVLGYYTTNTKWDGLVRSIKVKLKPRGPSTGLRAGKTVRARRQYRAPTEAEITAIVAGPSPSASAPPTPVEIAIRGIDRPPKPGETPRTTLVGEPQALRLRGRGAPEPAEGLRFTRDERLRIEWPVRQALDRRSVRILDRTGRPLPVEIPLAEGLVPGILVVELPLSAFARGDYIVELTAGAGSLEERSLVAFRVQ